ncbi:MAG: chorismate-binding protein [Mycobacteriales bacterium]
MDSDTEGDAGVPGRPGQWRGGLVEVDRLETGNPAELGGFLDAHGLGGEPGQQRGDTAVGLLIGAVGCARLGAVPEGRPSPVAVPEVVAVAYRRGDAVPRATRGATVGDWMPSWSDDQHAAAVEEVRHAIARGDVYQANVVGHRSAPFRGDPLAVAAAVAGLPGARYGGMLAGAGWVVASASPEQLVRVGGSRVTTVPIKGTDRDRDALRRSRKDRAEHVMIVDLERNDLARMTVPGSVVVEELYVTAEWNGLWHASSTVAGELVPGTTSMDVLRAVAPGGSVTGAPKHAACQLLAALEPVGRGVSMGAFGFCWPGGLDVGLTIRTVAAADGRVHLWAGGGITWGSDPGSEVREAHAKAAPVVAALAQVRPSSS